MNNRAPTRRVSHAEGVLLLVMALFDIGLLVYAAWSDSMAGDDEGGHLVSGIWHWQSGEFDLYRVNPPLVRLWACWPVREVAANRMPAWVEEAFQVRRPEFALMSRFVRELGWEAQMLLFRARLMVVPLSLLGLWICWRWARALFGARAGLLSAMLWCAGPNVLGHGHLITPDLGAAAVGLAAGYVFWRWCRQPAPVRALGAGVLLGLTLLTKFTWIVLVPLWPLIWFFHCRGRACQGAPAPWRRQAAQIAAIFATAWLVLHVGYGFEGTMRRLRDYPFSCRWLSRPGDPARGELGRINRFRDTWLGSLPVPLPFNYLLGMDVQQSDFDRGNWSYLRGEWRHGGWWYYYLYAWALKEPVGTLLLGATAGFWLVRRRLPRPVLPDEAALLLPPLAVVTLVSSHTGFNHHFRYVLPAVPFFYVWVARVAQRLRFPPDAATLWVAGLATWTVFSSLRVYPHSLSYFNECAGGPENGWRHLLHSNTDWGQDLGRLRRWALTHPDARPLYVAAAVSASPALEGWHWLPPPVDPREADPIVHADRPMGPQPGWYAVSVNRLQERDGGVAYLRLAQPVDRIGYTLWLYHLTESDVVRIRRQMEQGKAGGTVPAPAGAAAFDTPGSRARLSRRVATGQESVAFEPVARPMPGLARESEDAARQKGPGRKRNRPSKAFAAPAD